MEDAWPVLWIVPEVGAMVPPVAEKVTGKPTSAARLLAARLTPEELRRKLALTVEVMPGLSVAGLAVAPTYCPNISSLPTKGNGLVMPHTI